MHDSFTVSTPHEWGETAIILQNIGLAIIFYAKAGSPYIPLFKSLSNPPSICLFTWFGLLWQHTKHNSPSILLPSHVQLLLGDPEAFPHWPEYVNPFSMFWVCPRVSIPLDVPALPLQSSGHLLYCDFLCVWMRPNLNRKPFYKWGPSLVLHCLL